MAKFVYTGEEYLNADHIVSIDTYPSYRLITGDWDILRDMGTRRLPCYCTSSHLVPNAFSDRACSGAIAQNLPQVHMWRIFRAAANHKVFIRSTGSVSYTCGPGHGEKLMTFFNRAVDVLLQAAMSETF